MNDPISVQDAIDFLIEHRRYMTAAQEELLHREFPESPPDDETSVGSMNLLTEVQAQLRIVRKMRETIERQDDIAARDLKELITTSTTLFSLLVKLQGDLVNSERMRKIEEATVETIKTLPKEVQDLFFTNLERALDG